jgi:predicted histone-like DNA-binding protein
MSIKYVLLEKGNPSKPEEVKKWYVTAKSNGEVSLKAISKTIAQRSSVNYVDTTSVLKTLMQVLSEQLDKGKIVRLGDFGSFQIGIGSEGAEVKEKFTTTLIKSRKIVFRPGSDLKGVLSNLSFEKQ